MSFNNQNKVTEAELADDLKNIIINAESDHERSIYEQIAISNAKIDNATSKSVEVYSAISGATITFDLNKDAESGYYYFSTSSSTKYSLAAMLGEDDDHTFTISIAARSSQTNLILSFTDAEVYDRNGDVIVGGNTATATLPIYYKYYIFAQQAASAVSSLTSTSGLTASSLTTLNASVSLSVASTNSSYHTYVYIPTAFGTPKFTVGGFEGGFKTDGDTVTRVVNGTSITYKIYYTTNTGIDLSSSNKLTISFS